MAITKKPKARPAEAPSNVNVDELINKGGSVTRLQTEPAKRKPVYVQLRLAPDVIEKIDRSLQTRTIKTPRHTWLLEAIHEKLERKVETSR